MDTPTKSKAAIKLEATHARRERDLKDLKEEQKKRAELTAKLRALRLAKEDSEKKTTTKAAVKQKPTDSDWPWNLPQAHRR